jgi:hypothetical protein
VWGPNWRQLGPFHVCLANSSLEGVPLGQPPWPTNEHRDQVALGSLAELSRRAAAHGSQELHPWAQASLNFFIRRSRQSSNSLSASTQDSISSTVSAVEATASSTPASTTDNSLSLPNPIIESVDETTQTITASSAPATPSSSGTSYFAQLSDMTDVMSSVDLNPVSGHSSSAATTTTHDTEAESDNDSVAVPAWTSAHHSPRTTLSCPEDVTLDPTAVKNLSEAALVILNRARFDEHASIVIASIYQDACHDRPRGCCNVLRFLCKLTSIGIDEGLADSILEAIICLRDEAKD